MLDPGSDDEPVRALRRLARGATLALECVGRSETVELGLSALAAGGRLVVVGVGNARPSLPPLARFIGMELSVHGSFGSTPAEIETVLDLIERGRHLTRSDRLAGLQQRQRDQAGFAAGIAVPCRPGPIGRLAALESSHARRDGPLHLRTRDVLRCAQTRQAQQQTRNQGDDSIAAAAVTLRGKHDGVSIPAPSLVGRGCLCYSCLDAAF